MAVALGSNLGDRRRNLRLGRRALARCVEGLACSRIYETEPLYRRDQGPFLNACCVGRTRLAPAELLARLQEAERAAGRGPGGPRYGPRTLDLDLLLYGDRILETPGLRVPHPRMCDRAFVLIPLAEVAPEWVHPESRLTVAELAARVSPDGVVPRDGWRRGRHV